MDGIGQKLTQDEIRLELIGKNFRYSGPNGRVFKLMRLSENGAITAISNNRGDDSGVWYFTEGTADICIRMVIYIWGDPSCFGVAKLPNGNYVTDHGFLFHDLLSQK